MKAAYAAHARFVAPALATPGARPVILGFIIVESLYRIGQQLLGLGLSAIDPAFAKAVFDGSTAPGLLINLASFSILALVLALVLRVVHGRGLFSLIGAGAPFWPQFRVTFLAIAALFVAVELAFSGGLSLTGATVRPLPEWLLLLIPALATLLIQTGSEELFYRGYLQQQIAALVPNPLVWLTLPSLLFALSHVSPFAPVEANLAYFIWAFCFGLAASDLTARAGTLAPALALHMANNAYAFLIYGEEGGPDSGLALILFPPASPGEPVFEGAPLTGLVPDLALLALVWVAARMTLRR